MAHPRQHQGPLLDLPLDPGAHIHEGAASGPYFGRATRRIRDHPSPAKGLRRIRKPLDRAQLIAQVDERNQSHEKAEENHRYDQLMRRCRRQPPPVHPQFHPAKVGIQEHLDLAVIGKLRRDKTRQILLQFVPDNAAREFVPPH